MTEFDLATLTLRIGGPRLFYAFNKANMPRVKIRLKRRVFFSWDVLVSSLTFIFHLFSVYII